MEWTRVDVESEDSITNVIGGLSDLKIGLDTDAESMHKEFLGNLPHLEEVQNMHGEVVTGIEAKILSESVSTLGEFVSEFGGEWSETEIKIPFSANSKSDFVLDTKSDDISQIVRIIAPEKFGGMLRSFRLPKGRCVSEAIWRGGVISIKLD